MKKIVLILTATLLTFVGFSQQDAHYSQYMFNSLVINPAFAGSDDNPSLALFHRSQWVGTGANFVGTPPSTQSVSFSKPIRYGTGGFGAHIQNDRIGLERKQSFLTSFAYRINSKKSTLSFGLQAGLHTYRLMQPFIKDTDDERFSNLRSSVLPDIGAGIYYKSKDLYIGFSVPHLLETDFSVNNFTASALVASLQRHYFLTSAYSMEISRDFKVVPSFLFKIAENAPMSLDLNAHLYYNDMIWVGGTYRYGDAFSFQAGTKLQKLSRKFKDIIRIGYAYDLTNSSFRSYNKGSHEIMLIYDFADKSAGPMRTPRFRF